VAATRVIIVDDQRIFRVMLRETLSTRPEIELVGEATSGQEAIDLAAALEPEVVLMDIELGSGLSGIQAGRAIKSRRPATGIVLFSTHKSRDYVVYEPGWSYLLKNNLGDIDTLIRAITGAAWGLIVVDPEVVEALKLKHEAPLWQKSLEPGRVLELMAQGYDNPTIAAKLQVNDRAVEQWQELIYSELGIRKEQGIDRRLKAVAAYAQQNGQTPGDKPRTTGITSSSISIPTDQLTQEQLKILDMVADGASNKAIAEALRTDERSIQEHLAIIYYNLGIGSDPRLEPRVLVAEAYLARRRNPTHDQEASS
jgi:DNA-binding NarL/FixJ family response regulator